MSIDPGIAGAIGAGLPLIAWELFRGISQRVGKASSLPKRMDRVELILLQHGEELAVQTDIGQATLEALKGQCNGNVDAALGKIAEMKTKRDEFYRKAALPVRSNP